jgi:O-antigen/teichoic acid export membrane protein
LSATRSLGVQAQQRARSLAASDFVRKVSQTYASHIVRILLGLVTTVIVARALGPAGRGTFATAAAIGALGVQFGNLGLHTANTYFAARDKKSIRVLLGNSIVVSFGLGSLIAVAIWCALQASPRLLSLSGMNLVLAVAWIPFGLGYLLLQNMLLGMQAVGTYNLVDLFSKALPVVLFGSLIASGRATVPWV